MAGAEARAAPLPDKIGRHSVVGYIATGGMAELFLGKEPTGRPVVIKRILPHLARQGSFVSMFIDEARIGSRAKHPNLVEIHELGQVGIDLFLVMEYLVGENLAGIVRRLTKKKERMPYGLCAWIISEVCDGLQFAHEIHDEAGNPLELVHRDVSPQNVFVTYGGDVKLLDFGVATAAHRLTATASGEVKGKYAYMSPEQCRGEALDRRSDVFSLGTVLYELSTLRRLFKRSNELQVMKAISEEPIPPPSREVPGYPECLEDICIRALARNPADRYASAAEMRDDLLVAVDKLGLDGDPHEAIASKFARIFSDRMTQKHELLDRVQKGGDLTDLLVPEVDEQVDVPIVSPVAGTALSKIRPPPDGATVVRSGRRGWKFLAAFVFAILLGASVGAYLRLRANSTASAHDGGLVAVAEVVAVAAPDTALPTAPVLNDAATQLQAEDAAALPPGPGQDQYIVVSVDTDPDGVKVKVDGDERGPTPIDIRVKKGNAAFKIELVARGFDTTAVDVVPDRDQRLYFALMKHQKKIVPVTRPAKKDRGAGFHRFD